jgi:hypothetical protein
LALWRRLRRCARLFDYFSVEAPDRIRGDFDASNGEEFSDHPERRAFQPQFSDAIAERQQRRESLRWHASEIAHRFCEALMPRFSGGSVAHDAPPP